MADALTVSQLEELAKFAAEQGDIGKARIGPLEPRPRSFMRFSKDSSSRRILR